jgi:hypothetical protein
MPRGHLFQRNADKNPRSWTIVLDVGRRVASSIEEPPPPAKKTREKIRCLETPPCADWFVRSRERGRTVWYLRLKVTGMVPRRFGPFATRHKALLALDAILDVIADVMSDTNDKADEYLLRRAYDSRWGFVREDALALRGTE